MSSLAINSAATSKLPAVNILPQGHGHKKGALMDPFTDSTSNTAAQVPVGSTQNLFGSLFNSLQRIIGAQPATAAKTAAAASSTAAGAAAAAGAKINVMA